MPFFTPPPRNLACLLALGAFLGISPMLSALSDSTLDLVNKLKNKVNVAETGQLEPARSESKPDSELNAPPPMVTPLPSEPAPAIKPVEREPEPVLIPEEEAAPAKKKEKRSKKKKSEKAASTEENLPGKEPTKTQTSSESEPNSGPGPKPAHPQRNTESQPAPEPGKNTLRTSEASDLIKHIMEKLATVRDGHKPGQTQNRPGKPSAAPAEETAVDISSDYPAPATKPALVQPQPAPKPVQPPAPVPVSRPVLATGGERSFGELSDEELIQYAKEHVWSSEKSRKHNPPPTPPYRPKKKTTKAEPAKADAKALAAKTSTKSATVKTASKDTKSAKKATTTETKKSTKKKGT